ncbi:hypothetical protein AK812_SmicGene34341 [Symbiodinium microadriaticum]|uniref:Uncharacterized protein n=1 Tax=Symbiodinium microadriaticum TaxID=2951 RepID=A0A1Q9CP99_SYMMI|nr:hypothetical protein AK812_SmicGene34341 [Symbiodinium microadriaticum]
MELVAHELEATVAAKTPVGMRQACKHLFAKSRACLLQRLAQIQMSLGPSSAEHVQMRAVTARPFSLVLQFQLSPAFHIEAFHLCTVPDLEAMCGKSLKLEAASQVLKALQGSVFCHLPVRVLLFSVAISCPTAPVMPLQELQVARSIAVSTEQRIRSMDAGTSLMSLFIRVATPAGGLQLALSLLYHCCAASCELKMTIGHRMRSMPDVRRGVLKGPPFTYAAVVRRQEYASTKQLTRASIAQPPTASEMLFNWSEVAACFLDCTEISEQLAHVVAFCLDVGRSPLTRVAACFLDCTEISGDGRPEISRPVQVLHSGENMPLPQATTEQLAHVVAFCLDVGRSPLTRVAACFLDCTEISGDGRPEISRPVQVLHSGENMPLPQATTVSLFF